MNRLTPDPNRQVPRRTYPVGLLLHDKLCVVVGGGEVAARKAEALLAAGARLRIVAPQMKDAVLAIPGIERVQAPYDESHLRDAFVVIAATDSRRLNRRIAAHARDQGALVNVVDDPDWCDFIVPAVLRRGDLSITVQTGGASPALARNLRRKIEDFLPEGIADFTAALGQLRGEIIAAIRHPKRRREVLEFLATDQALQLFRDHGPDALRHRALAVNPPEPPSKGDLL